MLIVYRQDTANFSEFSEERRFAADLMSKGYMEFNATPGRLELSPSVYLSPRMKREELLTQSLPWEIWTMRDDDVASYRAIFFSPNSNKIERCILIVFLKNNNQGIASWDLGPADFGNGFQNRPEGKYTKVLQEWFSRNLHIELPRSASWGHIDAVHDPRNQTTSIVCTYQIY